MGPSDKVLYLYGIIPREQRIPAEPGIELAAVTRKAISAIVEPVSAADFSPEALETNLQQLEWVAGQARRHETVLERAMRHGAVIPARLCTLFSDEAALSRALLQDEARLLAVLERVRDREEWGLKMYCDEARLRQSLGGTDPHALALAAAAAGASPGQAFLLRKKRDAWLAELAEEHIDAMLAETIAEIEGDLGDVPLETLPAATMDRQEAPILNLAALVGAAEREAFEGTVSRLAERLGEWGVRFEISGPWPPYSFCSGIEPVPETSVAGSGREA